jgi:hypothetical protein
MRKEESHAEPTEMELRHLSREVKTALELAVVALCPDQLVERLAGAAGLLAAIEELPLESAPVVALVPNLVKRARGALSAWARWQEEHLRKAAV